MTKFIELTELDGTKVVINTDKIISFFPERDGTTFIDFYVGNKHPRGLRVAEGYEKVKCMLIDIFGGAQ